MFKKIILVFILLLILYGLSDRVFWSHPLMIPFAIKYHVTNWIKTPDKNLKTSNLKVVQGGSWTKAAQIPSWRYENGAAVLNREIYLVGGLTAPSVYNITKITEVYNPNNDSWRRVADFPKIIHHTSVASSKDKLYVAGGHGFRISTYNTLYEYSPKENKWTRLADMKTSRAAMAFQYYDGRLYAIGGNKNGRELLKTVEIYNIKTNKWTSGAPMPTAREHVASATVGDKIYVLGGILHNHLTMPLTLNEVYDIKHNSWEKKAPLPMPLSGMTATSLGKSIYVFGGQQAWSTSNQVFEYRVDEDRWYRRTNLPNFRYAAVVVNLKNKIHVLGGHPHVNGYILSQDHDVFSP